MEPGLYSTGYSVPTSSRDTTGDCSCSNNGVSGGTGTLRPGCGQWARQTTGQTSWYCYVTGGAQRQVPFFG